MAKIPEIKHYHFIGIGGIGMSGIAKILLERGLKVSGSDLKNSVYLEELKRNGAVVFIGHAAGNIGKADTVVYSSAIREDNPEFQEAKKRSLRLLKRAEALAEVMADRTAITVSGSHGKTTTTSLVSCLLMEAGLKPSVAIGGILKNIGDNACVGEGSFFVAEADESDASFLFYNPTYSIVTNIDHEHLDYYKDFSSLRFAFGEFLAKTQPGGCVFACSDDLKLKDLVSGYLKKKIFFGLNDGADIYPRNIEIKGLTSDFDCFLKGKFIDRFHLSLGGYHNISNALSVIALGLELGIGLAQIKKALAGYQGAGRRMEIKFRDDHYLLIDDYAHHPSEIRATLSAVKNIQAERIVAIFQPHRYTRTKLLLNEFATCFDLADYLAVTDIYAASESAIPGVSAQNIIEKIKYSVNGKTAVYLPKADIVRHILEIRRPGDLIITLGAGDITKISDELAGEFKINPF